MADFKALIDRAASQPWQFMRFLATGLLNSAFGFLVYCLFIYLGQSYFTASAAAMVLGVMFNYQTTRAFVFNRHDGNRALPFILSYGFILACTVCILELLGGLGMNPYLAGFVASIPMAILSYFLQKRFVFNNKKNAN
ncbi:MAG: GtrA family protein [Polaromonas sp.]|nr:GtrA family protein [Polaromonas sp.]